MACIYIYKDHLFNTELELDSYLLTKDKYYELYGDTVFSNAERVLSERAKLDLLKRRNVKLWEDYDKLVNESKITRDEDGDLVILADLALFRYIGVNKFLNEHHQYNNPAKYLHPYFDEREYFNRRFKDWADGIFNEVEIEIFFDGVPPSTTVKILDKATLYKYRDYLKTKWNFQARIGDAIHKVMETYFSDDENGKHIRDYPLHELYKIVQDKLMEGKLFGYLDYMGSKKDNLLNLLQTAKQVYNSLVEEYGENLYFFPEYKITGKATNDRNKEYDLFGVIDLLILDEEGKYHILDYKTSIKDYSHFDNTKRGAFSYLLATYNLMLENQGIGVQGASLAILPIQIQNFLKVDFDKYVYNGANYQGILKIDDTALVEKAFLEVERFMPSKYALHVTPEKMYEEIPLKLETWFGRTTHLNITEESTAEYLEKRGVFKKKNTEGKYTFSMRGMDNKIIDFTTDSKEEMIQKVLEERKVLIPARHRNFLRIKDALKTAIKNKDANSVQFPQSFRNVDGSSTHTKNILKPYCNSEWEVLDIPAFDDFLIIVLYNKEANRTDFIGTSTNDLQEKVMIDLNHKSILGKFETDAQAEQKFKRLTLPGIYGNIELLLIMLAINASTGFENTKIGNIGVINTYDAEYLTASNEELLTNFNALNKYSSVSENKYDNNKLKLASYYELLWSELTTIWTIGDHIGWKNPELYDFKKNVQLSKDTIEEAIDMSMDEKIKAVERLIYEMKTKMTYGDSLNEDITDLEKLNSDKARVYKLALYTLAELKGIHFRQLTEDGHKYYLSLSKIITEGYSSNMIDNPGNLDSDTLNSITSLVKEAYLNTRSEIQKEKPKLDKIIKELKENIGFSKLLENIGFNLANIYKEIIEEKNINGALDLWFKHVEDVRPEYRPLLEYALETINRNRFPNVIDLKQKSIDSPEEYYRIPLARGGKDSEVSARGLTNMLASRLKYLNPNNWKELYLKSLDAVERFGYSDPTASKEKKDTLLIYEMNNWFDRGEQDRAKAIEDLGGIEHIERNIETLILKHLFAYALKKHLDLIFPLLQAASIHLSEQGAYTSQRFLNDKEYFVDYVKSKIKKENIIDPNLQDVAKWIGILKSAASKMVLGFAPVQMFYLPLQGLWVDISLMIRKPDGKQSFTFDHFVNALKIVYSDLFNFSGEPTLCSKINELYALNDMDINSYIDSISKNKKGLFYNFDNLLYKFSSRPDYYNRLAIFLALMQGDSCLEAHSLVNGELVYDWTKDKRFSKFAANPHSNSTDPEFIKLRSLYYALAQLMVNEGSMTLEEMNDLKPLPKAYPTKLSEGYKSLADDIYGYYSEENKSLIQATVVGSMWLLFKTFWSGKKNLYLQTGGIRMRGSWENYTEVAKDENGEVIIDEETGLPKIIEYYYALNDDGSINFNKIVKKDELPVEKQLAPVVYWKGLWLEGIVVTLVKLIQKAKFVHNWEQMMLEDPDMARCYLSNVQQLIFDFSAFLIGGTFIGSLLADMLDDELEKNKANTDLLTGILLAAAKVALYSIKNSFLDFNILDSLGSPLYAWTPFSLSVATNHITNLTKLVLGETDAWDTFVNTFGVTKQIKPLFDTIKPEMFRTREEGGTWQSRTSLENQEQ